MDRNDCKIWLIACLSLGVVFGPTSLYGADAGLLIVNPGDGSDDPPPTAPGYRNLGTSEAFSSHEALNNLDLTDREGKRLTFWRNGFADVGVVALDGHRFCTATRISDDYVISAAHCFVFPSDNLKGYFIDEDLAFEFISFDSWSKHCGLRDGRVIEGCETTAHKVLEIEIHPQYRRVPKISTKFDVAILRIEPAERKYGSDVIRFFSEDFSIESPITIAGFGLTNLEINIEKLQIGWRESYEVYSDILAWEFDPSDPESSTCKFDSGGPIYLGRAQGYLSEARVLVGIIVGMEENDENVSRGGRIPRVCDQGRAINALLGTAETKAWLCSFGSWTGC